MYKRQQRGERRRFGDEARELLCRRAGIDHDYVVRLEEGSGLCADPLFFGPVGKMLGRKVVFFIEDVYKRQIEQISEIDALTGKKLSILKYIIIFPASHYAMDHEKVLAHLPDIRRDLLKQAEMFKEQDVYKRQASYLC